MEEQRQVRAHIIISGKVQGVFFREKTRNEALDLGLTGWVRNHQDGAVEAVFEGQENKVREILLWCKDPKITLAKVTNIEVKYEDVLGEQGFKIIP